MEFGDLDQPVAITQLSRGSLIRSVQSPARDFVVEALFCNIDEKLAVGSQERGV